LHEVVEPVSERDSADHDVRLDDPSVGASIAAFDQYRRLLHVRAQETGDSDDFSANRSDTRRIDSYPGPSELQTGKMGQVRTLILPTIAMWGFVALMVVVTVVGLRSRGHEWWVVGLGGVAAAVGSYLFAMLGMIAAMSMIAVFV
jgi:hypothetical protein